MSLGRYIQAFWGALRMTMRGETIKPAPPPSPLAEWVTEYARRIKTLLEAADQNGLDTTARKQIKLRLDGRQMSLDTVLLSLQFHATEEYTSLLRQGINQNILNTIYATNMNDHYWVITLAALPEMQKPFFQTLIKALETHLDSIPKTDALP